MNTTNARRNRGRRWRGTLAVLVGLSMLLIGWSPAGATATDDGALCWGFTSTRLMNDGISTSAGPFPIQVPAGTYDIEIETQDNHPSPDYQPLQTEEQVYLQLDSGYTSPFTNDIPNDGQWMTTTFSGVSLADTSAMTVIHRQFGVINSLNVIKVCFNPTVVDDEIVIVPPTTEPPPSSVAPPATTVPEATTSVAPPTSAVTPTTGVTTQVEGVTELALTGTSRSQTLAIAGLGMVILGVGLTLIDRRNPDLLTTGVDTV